MSNEAADKLRVALLGGTADRESGILELMLEEALAGERIKSRKATVERISRAVDALQQVTFTRGVIRRILEAEAAP